jgi:hypothetical protein
MAVLYSREFMFALQGKKRDLISMGVLIVLWLFGGIQPPGPNLQTMLPVIGPFLNAISPFRWSFEIQVRPNANC